MAHSHVLANSKELQSIKLRLEAGDTIDATAATFKRARSFVFKVRDSIKKGTFNEWLADVEKREAIQAKAGQPSGVWNTLSPDERRKAVSKLRAAGWKPSQIAKKLQTQRNNISYWFYEVPKKEAQKKTPRTLSGNLASKAVDAQQAKALELRAEKFSIAQIAKTLGVSMGAVGYYLYGRKQNGKDNTNGTGHSASAAESNGNGTINKNILIGIAYSETERFIGVLSTRLGVSTDLLRQRLSELLGHSPLR